MQTNRCCSIIILIIVAVVSGSKLLLPSTIKSSHILTVVDFISRVVFLYVGLKEKKKESSPLHEETSSGPVEDHLAADGSDGEKLREAAEKSVETSSSSSSDYESAEEQID